MSLVVQEFCVVFMGYYMEDIGEFRRERNLNCPVINFVVALRHWLIMYNRPVEDENLYEKLTDAESVDAIINIAPVQPVISIQVDIRETISTAAENEEKVHSQLSSSWFFFFSNFAIFVLISVFYKEWFS